MRVGWGGVGEMGGKSVSHEKLQGAGRCKAGGKVVLSSVRAVWTQHLASLVLAGCRCPVICDHL